MPGSAPPSSSDASSGIVRASATLFERANLTRAQFLIWTGQKLNPGVPLYNMALAYTIEGRLDVERFGRAFALLVDRTDALRTVIVESDGVPRQHVRASAPADVPGVDLAREPDPTAAARAWTEQRCARCFDLEACLFDTALLRLAPDRHVWFLNQHHLITDGWAKAVVYRRMADCYAAAARAEPAAPDAPSYEAYRKHEAGFRATPAFARARAHWRQKLAAPLEPLRLYGRSPQGNSPRTRRVLRELGQGRSQQLRKLASEKDVRALTSDLAIFNIFATVLLALMHRLSGNRTLSLGAPSHNRTTSDFKDTAGLFIEIHPLQVEIDDDERYASLLRKVAAATLDLLRHAQPGTSDFADNNAYSVLLNFINVSFADFAGMPTTSRWVHPGHGDRGHCLRLQVHDFDATGSYQLHFDVNEELFDPQREAWLIDHFFRMVDGLLADRGQPIDRVDLIDAAARQRLVVAYNRTEAAYPRDRTVVDLLTRQAQDTPDAVAVRQGDAAITYADLDARSSRLARWLGERGVGPDGLVGICMERCADLPVAQWGVLKAGGAYVPIDPGDPPGRIAFVLEDTRVPVLITQAHLRERLPVDGPLRIDLDADPDPLADVSDAGIAPTAGPGHLAYVIYTSGSTGRPKGVMVEHRGLLNYVCWARAAYLGGRSHDFPLHTAFSFDLTVTSLMLPLVTGGAVVVYPRGPDGADLAILDVLADDRVDVIKLTPAHLALMRDRGTCPSRLRKLIVGGEDLKRDLAQSIHDLCGGRVEIYNEYGPTEAVVGCMIHRFDPAADTDASVPIGRPAGNARIYVLDRHMKPVPDGLAGEMYIGGDGVARGYHGRPDLTEQRFRVDPFQPDGRLYRTGDVARWSGPAQLTYQGRIDDQVKVRGHRVELGEIEAVLAEHPEVASCAVVAVDEGQDADAAPRLCPRCGLASNVPGIRFDAEGVCNLCRAYDEHTEQARRYFSGPDELGAILRDASARRTGRYDCLMLYSGGKDSTYALYQLVDMGLKVLVFSFDNGYISDGAKANVHRVVADLGVDLHWARTDAMNAIFADSLARHSNVCNGCFKAIYTLAVTLARREGIRAVVTGLSRGQFFDTRISDLFRNRIFEPDAIDATIIEARKAYHRMDDAVARCLDVSAFRDDTVFDEVRFVDFYRYCDVPLDEVLAFLERRASWVRPADTGRSTNCLINEVGIYVHKKERGYHNYAEPYAWDVRLGHKQRAEALQELDDDIDEPEVHRILHEIGYRIRPRREPHAHRRLVAYYAAVRVIDVSELRAHLGRHLPDPMIPAHFVPLAAMPLTPHGKIDRGALPAVEADRPDLAAEYVAPRTEVERALSDIWANVLRVERVGVHDDFLELGGDSILNIQIVARANEAGIRLTPAQLFEHPTIADLAAVAAEGGPPSTVPPEPAGPDRSQMDKIAALLNRADRNRTGTKPTPPADA